MKPKFTWQKATSFGNFSATSLSHWIGLRRGRKSATTEPIFFFLTKAGKTSGACPCKTLNEISNSFSSWKVKQIYFSPLKLFLLQLKHVTNQSMRSLSSELKDYFLQYYDHGATIHFHKMEYLIK